MFSDALGSACFLAPHFTHWKTACDGRFSGAVWPQHEHF